MLFWKKDRAGGAGKSSGGEHGLFAVKCSNCGLDVEAARGTLSQILPCPNCKEVVVIPAAEDNKADEPKQVHWPLDGMAQAQWKKRDLLLGGALFAALMAVPYGIKSYIIYRPDVSSFIAVAWFFVYFICIFSFVAWIYKKRSRYQASTNVGPLKIVKEFFVSFLLFVVIGIALSILGFIMQFISDIPIENDFVRKHYFPYMSPNSFYVIFLQICAFTAAPIIEEIFFRGFLYNGLKRHIPKTIAVYLQALLFSLVHGYSVAGSILIFVTGAMLAFVYEYRKNLLAPIFVHVITNAVWAIPLLFLSFQNLHAAAKDYEQAKVRPEWVSVENADYIVRQEDGQSQRDYAIDTWGSKGLRQWKKEVNAFYAVLEWFPEDRKACAQAQLGIVSVYSRYLRDYRRCVVEAERLLTNWPEWKTGCSSALLHKGWAHYRLREFSESRSAFEKVLSDFHGKEFEWDQASARDGLEGLDFLGY